MRKEPLGWAACLCLLLAGCGRFEGPKLVLATARETDPGKSEENQSSWPAVRPRTQTRYNGRTAERWAELLEHADRGVLLEAARALKVLGAEGRPHLVQGLQSANPETRRICLETLTVSDLRVYGEEGKQLLVKLSGDLADLRIRERAALYIAQWNRTLPAY